MMDLDRMKWAMRCYAVLIVVLGIAAWFFLPENSAWQTFVVLWIGIFIGRTDTIWSFYDREKKRD